MRDVFERWGTAVVRHPVRVILAWVVVVMGLGGLGLAVLGPEGPAAVAGQNETDFLPDEYESVRAAKFAAKAFPSEVEDGATAVLVLSRSDGAPLAPADQSKAREVVGGLGGNGVRGVSEPSLSPNGKVMLAQVTFTGNAMHTDTLAAVKRLRTETAERVAGTPLRSGYTGEAAVMKDSELLDMLVSGGMVAMILVLLVVIFRTPWVALLNLLIIAMVGQGAVAVIAIAAKVTGTTLDGSVTGLLPVVLFGVGTDYVVFLLYRYRERLRLGEDRRTAMVAALSRVGSAIGVSALAVAVSFGALLLSGFGSFRILGPALAFAVLVMVLAGLTLIPAVFSLLGHRAFWPSKAWRLAPKAGLAARTGNLVARRPAAVALTAVAILTALGAAALAHKPSYDIEAMPSGTESARTMQRLESGFPAGTLSPTSVFLSGPGLTEQSVTAYAEKLSALSIVGEVGGVRVAGDAAQVDLLLAADPLSEKALDAMLNELRPAAHETAPPGTTVYVGGETSVFADLRDVVEVDLRLILPAAGILIGLVLLLMLRGVLAPLYLLAAVVGGFAATLGAAVLVFQGAAGRPGLTFTLPLIVYMFVASIGTDYNILMIARIREELRGGASPREAVREALRQAGPPVAAAGVILAASFGALAVSATLAEVGFAVAVGILLSTFVLSWLLVPALTALVGRAAFWPARAGTTSPPLQLVVPAEEPVSVRMGR